MEQVKRIRWIDIAKAIGVIIVLIYHACPEGYLKNFLWQMHMPFFAFLSGVVYNEKYSMNFKNLKKFLFKRIKTIYLPFIKYSLVFLIFHNLFYKIHFIGTINGNKIFEGVDYIKQIILILTLGGGESLTGALWYLIPLLELEILFAIILLVSMHLGGIKKQAGITIIICIAIYFLLSNASLPRNLSNAARLLLFYCMGYYIKKYDLLEGSICLSQKIFKFVGLFIIWGGITIFSSSWQGTNLFLVAISASAGIYCIVSFSQFISKYVCDIGIYILEYIGQKTMVIVALHFLMYCFVKVIYVSVHNMDKELIAEKEAICDFKWIGIYVLAGLIGSLFIDFIFEKIKKYLKMFVFSEKNLYLLK